jgi:Arc/MetJ-type ribon-helix-helix transcriptional regulator
VNDSEELIHVRIGSELKKRIQELVDRGEYKDITAFVKGAIIERLDPYWDIEKVKRSILYLKEKDPEFRKMMNLKE